MTAAALMLCGAFLIALGSAGATGAGNLRAGALLLLSALLLGVAGGLTAWAAWP